MTNEEREKFYYSDGRINPDKAFTYILETMETLSPEEFLRFATPPSKSSANPGPPESDRPRTL